jgi:hypothetical protein
MTVAKDSTTSLYRYYDAKDFLIYVGITSQGIARNQQHNSDKDWWPFVHHQTVEHFPTRAIALKQEKAAILLNQPPFNRQHNPHHEDIRDAYLELAARSSFDVAHVKEIYGRYDGIEDDIHVLSFLPPFHLPPTSFKFRFGINLGVYENQNDFVASVRGFRSRGPMLKVLVNSNPQARFTANDRFIAPLKGPATKKLREIKRIVRL